MRRNANRLAAVAAVLLVAACGEGSREDGIGPTGPRLLVGPTASVVVSCPSQMEEEASAQCTAYGYDSNGTFTSSNASSWSTSTPSNISVYSGGSVYAVLAGTANVSAVIDGVGGSTSITIVPPPAPVINSIAGPTSVQPSRTCEWIADVSYGAKPLTFSWSQSSGSGSGSDNWYYGSSSSSFTLSLTVTDRLGRSATASKSVSVSTKAPTCIL